jgi:catechol 2,3-dioxygenase-like lactoylglutathione lyase family enzyme
VHLFHYHLVTSMVRDVEARYVGRLGFRLVARHGRVGETQRSFEPGVSWEELDALGFKLRLSELERGAVNVVVQPGHWKIPRVDHLGLALEEAEFQDVLAYATEHRLRVQEHAGRRTFVATNAGYRLEIHPPRDWLEELVDARDELWVAELQLRSDEPPVQAEAMAAILGLPHADGQVWIGDTLVTFVPGGPDGRPELLGEQFAT